MRTDRFKLPVLGRESLLLGASLFLTGVANLPLWTQLSPGVHWRAGAALAAVILLFNYTILALLSSRWTVRPLLLVLLLLSAPTAYFIGHYGVVIDPGMVRNVLQTEVREARELIDPGFVLLALLSLGCVISILIWPLQAHSLRQTLKRRGLTWLGLLAITALALWLGSRDLSALMRNEKHLRYMITPANVVWSVGRVSYLNARAALRQKAPPDPVSRQITPGKKPLLVVMVVGETARAANWGLNGYARDTTPALSKLPVLNFPDTTSCGTATEISLPCMFSPFGRANYDEDKIRNHESVLQQLHRAGVSVTWLDNQSGCKGVCDGLDFEDVRDKKIPGLCREDFCYDEVLVEHMNGRLKDAPKDRLVVLHQLGNHGPAYYKRYPEAYEVFKPACRNNDLGKCSIQEIVNAYDNALRYTDAMLAAMIESLQAQQKAYDVMVVYVSDHGESLGERGLFLHGMPYSIAPREQTQVPMVWWLPPAIRSRWQLSNRCLDGLTAESASHDTLYHLLLGAFSVETPYYQKGLDLLARCRGGS